MMLTDFILRSTNESEMRVRPLMLLCPTYPGIRFSHMYMMNSDIRLIQ